jgi:hypothetical protein
MQRVIHEMYVSCLSRKELSTLRTFFLLCPDTKFEALHARESCVLYFVELEILFSSFSCIVCSTLRSVKSTH